MSTVGELLEKLRSTNDTDMIRRVVEAMTTNETSFFRDVNPFEALRYEIFPRLVKSRSDTKVINLWCAACSTGQEPYSIAMLLRDAIPDLGSWSVTITATDLATDVLERAKEGSFTQLEVNRGLASGHLSRHFDKEGDRWRVKPEVRRLIDFRQLNLDDHWPVFPPLDVVFLRNVLIYFNVDTKRKILESVKRFLAPDGYLFLGAAESTLGLSEEFQRSQAYNATYYRHLPHPTN